VAAKQGLFLLELPIFPSPTVILASPSTVAASSRPALLRDVPENAHEVSVTLDHDAAAGTCSESALRFLDVFKHVVSQRSHERFPRPTHLILFVNPLQKEATRSVIVPVPVSDFLHQGLDDLSILWPGRSANR